MFGKVKRRRASSGKRSASNNSDNNSATSGGSQYAASNNIKLKSILVTHKNNYPLDYAATSTSGGGGSSINDSSLNYTDGGGSSTQDGGGSSIHTAANNNKQRHMTASSSCGSSSLGSKGTRTTRSSSQIRRVRFRNVQFREFERVIGDNPSCSSGAPVSIGWAHGKDQTVRLDDYERSRPQRRNQLDLVLTRQDREDILLEWGASFGEIIEAIRSNIKAKNQRRNTVNTIGRYDRWEEMMEKAGRKIKRTIFVSKKSSDKKVEAYLYASQQHPGIGNGSESGDSDNDHHHHRSHVVGSDDDVTVYTTMPMSPQAIHQHNQQQHPHHQHHRPPPMVVSHPNHTQRHHSGHDAPLPRTGSTGIQSNSSGTPDTVHTSNLVPLDHQPPQQEQRRPALNDTVGNNNTKKTSCLEANAPMPMRRASESSKHSSPSIIDLMADDDEYIESDDDEKDEVKEDNKNSVLERTNPPGPDEADVVPDCDVNKNSIRAGNGVSQNSESRDKPQQQPQQQQQHAHRLTRQDLDELIVDPNAPIMEVDVMSQSSLPSYYSFSDDVTEYYMTEDGDDDNGNGEGDRNATMEWRILTTVHESPGYPMGKEVVGGVGDAGSSNSGDVDRGFASLQRDTSHWEVGGQGMDAPMIRRRFIPTIISEDMSAMPQQFLAPQMQINLDPAANGSRTVNDGPPVYHRAGAGVNDGPPIFHRAGANDGAPVFYRPGANDGPPVFHRAAPVATTTHQPPQLPNRHASPHQQQRMIIDPTQQQAALPQQQHYLNQGLVIPSHHAPYPSAPPYVGRWE